MTFSSYEIHACTTRSSPPRGQVHTEINRVAKISYGNEILSQEQQLGRTQACVTCSCMTFCDGVT